LALVQQTVARLINNAAIIDKHASIGIFKVLFVL